MAKKTKPAKNAAKNAAKKPPAPQRPGLDWALDGRTWTAPSRAGGHWRIAARLTADAGKLTQRFAIEPPEPLAEAAEALAAQRYPDAAAARADAEAAETSPAATAAANNRQAIAEAAANEAAEAAANAEESAEAADAEETPEPEAAAE